MTQVPSQGVSLLCEYQHREVGRSHTGLGSAFRSCPSCFLFLDRLGISWSPLSLFVNLGQGPPRTPYLKGLLWGLQESMGIKHLACNEHSMCDRCWFPLTPGKIHVYRLQKTLVPNRFHSFTSFSETLSEPISSNRIWAWLLSILHELHSFKGPGRHPQAIFS